MADMQSPQHPLEVLPAMLNLVVGGAAYQVLGYGNTDISKLLQTAKILRDPECHNPKQAGLTKFRISKIVTVANQRFHDALDEIEVEILRAKAVMERDLRLIQQKRIERDRANGIIVEPSPSKAAEEPVVADTVASGEGMVIDAPSDQAPVADTAGVATEPPLDSSLHAPKETDEKPSENEGHFAISTSQDMPQDSEDSLGLAITMPPTRSESQERLKDPVDQPSEPAPATKAAVELPIDISGTEDFDFESMFNDNDMTQTDDALDFDFGLSTDPGMSQDILNDSSFGNINMNNPNDVDLTNVPVNANEDIEGVLPGLENYLNTDADFSNIGMPAAATASAQTSQAPLVPPGQMAAATDASTQNQSDAAPAATSFDNFFGDFDVGGTGTDELGDGTLGDLDDFDWS